MTIKVSKPAINIREELADLKQDTGIKGQELMRADTVAEVRTAIGAGRKNLIINGGFDVSQRGDYSSVTNVVDGAYTLDRWYIDINAISATFQQLTTAYKGGVVNTLKTTATSSATGALQLIQQVEDYSKLAGREVTISAKVKSNNSFTRIQTYDGVGFSDTSSSRHTGGGDWEDLVLTTTISPSATSLQIRITGYSDGVYPLTSGDYIEIAQVQLELGSVATDFEHRSYGEELALCKRYYEKSAHFSSFIGSGNIGGRQTPCYFEVEKRTTPTVTLSNNTADSGGVTTASDIDSGGFQAKALTSGRWYGWNYTADAEL